MAQATTPCVKIDIVGGFLGAGKTTFINKLLADGLACEKVALIENEFGDEAIDSEVIEAPGFDMRTLASGCICCTLKADFVTSISDIVEQVRPDRILIEPTGLAGPAELEATCSMDMIASQLSMPVRINSMMTIVDATDAAEMVDYEIPVYLAQIEQARFIVLSHTQELDSAQLAEARSAIERVAQPGVPMLETPWSKLDGLEVLGLAEQAYAQAHAQTHDGAEGGTAGPGHHDHEGGHAHAHGHAGFASKVLRPQGSFDQDKLDRLSAELAEQDILRAKGFLPGSSGATIHYEFVHGRARLAETARTGDFKLVVIGLKENLDALNLDW